MTIQMQESVSPDLHVVWQMVIESETNELNATEARLAWFREAAPGPGGTADGGRLIIRGRDELMRVSALQSLLEEAITEVTAFVYWAWLELNLQRGEG